MLTGIAVDKVDGVRYLAMMPMLLQQISHPMWTKERGTNILDGAAPFYDTYKTKDGLFMAVYAPSASPLNIAERSNRSSMNLFFEVCSWIRVTYQIDRIRLNGRN